MLFFWLGRRCVRRVILAAVLLLGAAAWFGWPSRAAAPAGVTISGFAFAPATLTVPRGTTVTWTNEDDEPHTVASADDPRRFKSGALDTGDRFSFTFDTPGTYKYFCTIHPHMQGVVVVR
ncbi:MAG TPA: cupredoxin family copper-binding protein [Stellaceae bacterium]|nr:cupredoxin family copper-binding protein [Stellaceae bacterium]